MILYVLCPNFRSCLMIDLGLETDGNNEICLGVRFALCICMYRCPCESCTAKADIIKNRDRSRRRDVSFEFGTFLVWQHSLRRHVFF